MNMAYEAKLCRPICSTFGVLNVQCMVRHWEELSPFFWPKLAAGVAIFSTLCQFAEQTTNLTFFCASLALGSVLELLLSPATELALTSCRIQSTFCCKPQSNREMVHCSQHLMASHYSSHLQGSHLLCKSSWTTTALYIRCIEREDDISNDDFFWLFGQLMRHSLIESFHLSNLLQILNNHGLPKWY